MDKSELETMRKSFNTVKRRSDSIKNSPSTLRLKERVREIKKDSIENNEHYLKQAIESFKRNDIEVRIAETCDDALKIAYPNESIMHDIMRKTASVPNVSDRFHGRKIYSMLYTAKYKNIKIKTFLIDTGNKDIEERYALFYSAFVWRKNYFKNQLEKASSQEEIEKAMEEYNDINNLLDKIENLFTDQSFYFGYYVTIAIGQKKDFGLFD